MLLEYNNAKPKNSVKSRGFGPGVTYFRSLELLLKSIAQIRKFINPNLDICGILLTMADKRTNFTKEIISMIEQEYGEEIHIFKNHVPHSVSAAEISAAGKSIFSHDPNGKVAAAYNALVMDVLA